MARGALPKFAGGSLSLPQLGSDVSTHQTKLPSNLTAEYLGFTSF
jgi:hypothetical protein